MNNNYHKILFLSKTELNDEEITEILNDQNILKQLVVRAKELLSEKKNVSHSWADVLKEADTSYAHQTKRSLIDTVDEIRITRFIFESDFYKEYIKNRKLPGACKMSCNLELMADIICISKPKNIYDINNILMSDIRNMYIPIIFDDSVIIGDFDKFKNKYIKDYSKLPNAIINDINAYEQKLKSIKNNNLKCELNLKEMIKNDEWLNTIVDPIYERFIKSKKYNQVMDLCARGFTSTTIRPCFAMVCGIKILLKIIVVDSIIRYNNLQELTSELIEDIIINDIQNNIIPITFVDATIYSSNVTNINNIYRFIKKYKDVINNHLPEKAKKEFDEYINKLLNKN